MLKLIVSKEIMPKSKKKLSTWRISLIRWHLTSNRKTFCGICHRLREELNFDQMKQKWIAYVNAYGSNVPGEINTVGKFAKRMGYKYDESKGTYYK